MYNVLRIDDRDVKSYATEKNARAAIEKALGPGDERNCYNCNVLIVCNSAGRYVPIIMNVKDGDYGLYLHAGFFIVN